MIRIAQERAELHGYDMCYDMGMIRTLVNGGINWNWYLQADFNETDRTCHIYFYDRWHKYEYRGSKHPKHETGTSWTILETEEKREVFGILFDGIEYQVTNPANVFSYRDRTHYEPED